MGRALGLLIAAFLTVQVPAFAFERHGDLDGIGTGRPLVIELSGGGDMDEYRLLGMKLAREHEPVILDGYCASACTALLDMDRDNVCLTTNAVLAYHLQHYKDDKDVDHWEPISYETPGLNAYLLSRGGLPAVDVMLVPFEEAKRFYKPCAGAPQ